MAKNAGSQSVNDEIVDSYAAHDIDIRKLDGDIRNKVDKVLVQLGRDLKDLLIRIDPYGTQRQDARKRRMSKLRDASRATIGEAYVEIGRLTRQTNRRLAKVEVKATNSIIRENLP